MRGASVRAFRAIIRKDWLSFYPLLILTAALQCLDVLVGRLQLWPALGFFLPTALILANSIVILAVIQADAPVSLTDDWLCRPVPRGPLIAAKLGLLAVTLYLPRALTMFIADLAGGYGVVESVLESLLFQDSVEMLYVPIVLMAATCTATLIQGIAVMIGIFVLVFVVPTPFVMPPSPEDLKVGEAIQATGLMWVGMVPGKMIFASACAICLWSAYGRRNLKLARVVFGGGIVLGMAAIIAPIVLLPFRSTFAVQRAVHDESSSHEPLLRHAAACFPAQRVGSVADSADGRKLFGLSDWDGRRLDAAGKDSIAFLTRGSPRGLPEDWRLHTAYATANYFNDADVQPSATVRPSRFVATSSNGFVGDDPDGEVIRHTWLLPETTLRSISQLHEPRLELDYTSVVLEPVVARLPADGKRRYLPRIGICSAAKDTIQNRIKVDCFSAGVRPAMIAAELDGILATRVDSQPIDLAPAAVRLFKTRREELSIASPGLSESNTIKVTGYYPAKFVMLRTSTKGVLGNSADTCPLPMPGVNYAPPVSSWNDRSPHERRSVVVGENVQLEVLDWGGTGRPLVLLHGLGATSHSFDDFAPLLAKKFRVIGITRRGIGYSSRPDHGYGQARLAQDIVDVIDALHIDKAVFAGHSIAGDELTTLGAQHPDRVEGLIYLDAAYDRSGKMPSRYRELKASLPEGPQPHPEDLQSYSAILRYIERVGSTPIPEGELIALRNMGHPYLAGQLAIEPRLIQAIEAAISRPNYTDVRVPALAIYATSAGPDALLKPWHDANDVTLRETLREVQGIRDSIQRREIDKFRSGVQRGRVLELPGAAHWIFGSHPGEVLEAIDEFVMDLPSPDRDTSSAGQQ